MSFVLPPYSPPDFTVAPLKDAPLLRFQKVDVPGVAPGGYHATSVFPEYCHVRPGEWALLERSRMDCVIVRESGGALRVREFRTLKVGEEVAVGRGEDGEDGIYVHTEAFLATERREKFAFRTRTSRETSFSVDYDELYELLPFERNHGSIVWVLGPAVVFDKDARDAFVSLIEGGYVNGLLAGNALATHDLEGACFNTALGQEIYSKRPVPAGHYNHLDTINFIRREGSIKEAIRRGMVKDGVMKAVLGHEVPYVLAGSIRDDGPLPEVVPDVYLAQDRMRAVTSTATTIIALATQLHTIAVGNMTPSYHVTADGAVRPVFFYCVDMSEFAVNKLADRGSLTAHSILTNVQDFVVTLERGLRKR